MTYAIRIKLHGLMEVKFDSALKGVASFVFNDFIVIPPRIIREVNEKEGVVYLNPNCSVEIQNRALHLRYRDILAEPGENAWGEEPKKLHVFFPISRVTEYGPVQRPPV